MRRPVTKLTILTSFLLLAACQGERASGPLRQEAYVWQRSWTPAVEESVRQATDFAGLLVLAAEVDLGGQDPRVIRIPLDVAALRAAGRPVGAAVRVTTFAGRFADDPRLVQLLARVVRDVTAESRAKRLGLTEIQLDYDCPESKLADYRGLLPALRRAARPVPLTITALPTWMRQRLAFRKLIEEAHGYVLQLHSLKPPDKPGNDFAVIDARPARYWVEEAARFGRSFRAALPTYGYTAAFDRRGFLLGVLAEGPLVSSSAGVTVRTVRSDPAAMAELIRRWTRDRPVELAGVLWYRLPVESERLNWTSTTLRSVKRGRTPRGELRVAVRRPEPGLVEIDLQNSGDGDTPWPTRVHIGWKGDILLAADGLAGYAPRREGARALRLERPGASAEAVLRPGDRRIVAWLRFGAPTEVEVELPREKG